MNSRIMVRFHLLLATLFVCTSTAGSQVIAAPRNVVFFLADDLGWTGLKSFGSDFYETPNLDRLAERSLKFTDAYSACTVCSPTRGALMTGMYPARLRLTDFIAGQNRPFAKLKIPNWTKGLKQDHVTIAEALQKAGYTTAHVGKWHLNFPQENLADGGPTAHGFKHQFLKPAGSRGYTISQSVAESTASKSNYLTDYLTDQALTFLDSHGQEPFFLYFAYHVPHTPIQGRKDLVDEFQKKLNPKAVHKNPKYAAMVASMDQSVGRILQKLDSLGLRENTVVIFTSDNGGLTQRYGKHDGFTENLPLRRGKGSAYEGGVRVPAIVDCPGVTSPGECSEPIITMDFYPTILSLAGAKGDAGHNRNVDGVDLLPLLRDPKSKLGRDLFWHYPHYHAGGDAPYSAVRSSKWRFIDFHDDRPDELYDLGRDLSEKENLINKHEDIARSMRAKLDAWRKSIQAQMPTKNPDYDAQRATQVRRQRKRRAPRK